MNNIKGSVCFKTNYFVLSDAHISSNSGSIYSQWFKESFHCVIFTLSLMPCRMFSLSASIFAYLAFLSSSCCLSASCLSSSFFAASGSFSSSPPSILPMSLVAPVVVDTQRKRERVMKQILRRDLLMNDIGK